MQINTITSYLESIAPLSLQEEYDNSGLLIGNAEADITGVLICIDCTEAVLDEAIRKKCNLVISHHPVIFKEIKNITGSNYTERIIEKAIRNDIAVYAIHTNLDNVFYGVNKKICDKLGLNECKILLPHPSVLSPQGEGKKLQFGAGSVGILSKPMSEATFLKKVKKSMKTFMIRHTPLLGRKVRKVAVCGGSGSFLLPDAIAAGADVFITADFKYHQFFDAENKIVIADIGHYESEQFTKELLRDLLHKKFSIFAVRLTEINTNPIHYL